MNLPLDLEKILEIDENSEFIEATFSSGLTAHVYKININNHLYTLKRKRKQILVQNTDGQTSFLNEIQRRHDFERLKKINPERFNGIVDTVYASLNDEIILSDWIEGEFITEFSRTVFESIYRTMFEVEKEGLFECDLSSPNLLVDKHLIVQFFDFGYMYPYNPLTQYNSDGKVNPIFHVAERLESRFLMQHLINLETKTSLNNSLKIYKIAKETALEIYSEKLNWLIDNKADDDIIHWQKGLITLWENGLKNDDTLLNIYDLESFRSYVLDVNDDLSGRSCTLDTLIKIDSILSKIQSKFDFLSRNNGLFWGDEILTKQALILKYTKIKEEAIRFQLK